MKKLLSLSLLLMASVMATQAGVPKKWDFTKWSDATVANLKAESAKGITAETGAAWSDVEKADATAPTDISAGKCFWEVTAQGTADGAQLKANGEPVAELDGLLYTNTAHRSLAIAVDYPETSLGTYHGASYLWLGSKERNYFIIPGVVPGATIRIGVESHNPKEERGVQLHIGHGTNGTLLKDANGNEVAPPTTYVEQEWVVPTSADDALNENGTFDVQITNTNGCHIYFIEVSDWVEGISAPVVNVFNAVNEQGISIQYRVVSETAKTCEVFAEPYEQGVTFRPAVPKGTLGEVVIPAEVDGYKVVGLSSWSFYSCAKVTIVTLPETVSYIGESAFRMATALRYINLPDGLTEIADYTFSGATHLQEIDIPEGVTTIGNHAFANNYMLASVTLPSTLTTIAKTAFQHPRMLEKVIANMATPVELTSGNFDTHRDNAKLYVPAASKAAYEAAESWQGFAEVNGYYRDGDLFTAANEQGIDIQYRVLDSKAMTCETYTEPYEEGKTFAPAINKNTEGELIIPAEANGFSVVGIGAWSFRECQQLTSVQVPAGVTYIGASAFRMDRQLTAVNIPEGVTVIGDNAFRGNRMEIVTLPSTLREIEADAFVYISSAGIEENGSCYFVANMTEPCDLGKNAIHYAAYYDLYVPKGSLEAYQSAAIWKNFRSIQEIGAQKEDEYISVADMAITAGDDAHIDIYLTTEADYTGYQLRLALPEGMQVATNSRGTCIVENGADNAAFITAARQQGDGSYIVLAYTMTAGATVKGGENYLLRIPVHTSSTLPAGTYTARVEDILFASPTASSALGNKTFDITIESQAVVENRELYAENAEVEAGQTFTVPVVLNTKKAVDGVQYVITMPKGLTITDAEMDERFADKFMLSYRQHGNSYKILFFSMQGDELPADAGAVVKLTVKADANIESGKYAVLLSGIMLAYSDGSDAYPDDSYSVISVAGSQEDDVTPGDVNGDGEVNVRDVVLIVSYIVEGTAPDGFNEKAADVNGDGDINVRDVVTVVDITLSE